MSFHYIPSDVNCDGSRKHTPIYTGGPTPGIVTQEMLSEIRAFRELKPIITEFRNEVMDIILKGGCIEAGRLTAEVRLNTQRRLTKENLTLAMGREEFNRIYDLLPISTQRALYLFETCVTDVN